MRVLIISFEFLLILVGLVVFFFYDWMLSDFGKLSLNDDALKWAFVLPLTIVAATLKEGVSILFPNEEKAKAFSEWPDYWKLKAHFNVGISTSIVLGVSCFLIWIGNKLEENNWLFLFSIFTASLLVNAYSFYLAKIKIKSLLVKLSR